MKHYAVRRISDGRFYHGERYINLNKVEKVYGALTPKALRKHVTGCASVDYVSRLDDHEVVKVDVKIVGVVNQT